MIRRSVLIPAFAIAVVAAAVVACALRSPPDTKIGAARAGWRTKTELTGLLQSAQFQNVTFEIQNRTYTMRLSQLGVDVDTRRMTDEAMAVPRPPLTGFAWLFRLFTPRIVPPALTFTEEYDAFVSTMPEGFAGQQTAAVIDDDTKQIISLSDEPAIAIDGGDFRRKIIAAYGNPGITVRPRTYPVKTDRDEAVDTANDKLRNAFGRPLNVDMTDIERQKHILVTFSPEELKTLIALPEGRSLREMAFTPKTAEVVAAVAAKVDALNLPPLTTGTVARIGQELADAVLARYRGSGPDTVPIPLGDMPNTDGRKADRYIEVDISQQRMYLFNRGQLSATYRVSSGLDTPTPPGSYRILNKAPNAFSKIYNVFMPYWMAFYFDPKLGASLGIHELPYWMDSTGKKIQRPRDFIGSPHTGGCIALDVGVAREVYAFADVGTPLYIYQ
jgi:hypothetical protein